MLSPLIVSSNPGLVQRMKSEANDYAPEALITNSYIQGLRWIHDQTVPLSGIYLDPTDPNYSAIRFLTLSLLQRPATPVFILDQEGGLSDQNFACLSDKFKIQKAFKGEIHFHDLLVPLQLDIPEELEAQTTQPRASEARMIPGYVAVPVIDFIHSKHYPFNVFVEDEHGQLRFFAMEESLVDLEYLQFLSRKTAFLYVEESSIKSRRESFQFVEQAYLDPDYLSPSWRSAETLYRTKILLEKLKQNGVNEEVVKESYTVIQNLYQLVGQLSRDQYLKRFVDQAKQSDRTVACATWSALLCRQLKFESTSGTESLGVASFFQDISLYNSPFGNISETPLGDLSPAAQVYYFEHPKKSAQQIEGVESVPELVKQIVRQHHERPDRTGFPAKIGGPNLQPLAEILSLINSYLDHTAHSESDSASSLDLDVFSHYTDRTVQSFKGLLSSLGKWGPLSPPPKSPVS
jgi:hypothetical protein